MNIVFAAVGFCLPIAVSAASTNSFVNFETAPVHPVALSPDGSRLAVCNLPDTRLELFDVGSGVPVSVGSVPVGLDPVTVRFRTSDEVWVVNQISDSLSVVDLRAMRIVATISTLDAPADVVEALRRYGELLGIAFQMADDMVDFSPDSGKPIGLDIRQRALSLPLIYAAEDRSVGKEVRTLLAGSLGDKEVDRVADLVTTSDALRRVGDEARGLVEEAVQEIEAVELDGLRPTLVGLARSAVDRTA